MGCSFSNLLNERMKHLLWISAYVMVWYGMVWYGRTKIYSLILRDRLKDLAWCTEPCFER